jgi:hypothetical protein
MDDGGAAPPPQAAGTVISSISVRDLIVYRTLRWPPITESLPSLVIYCDASLLGKVPGVELLGRQQRAIGIPCRIPDSEIADSAVSPIVSSTDKAKPTDARISCGLFVVCVPFLTCRHSIRVRMATSLARDFVKWRRWDSNPRPPACKRSPRLFMTVRHRPAMSITRKFVRIRIWMNVSERTSTRDKRAIDDVTPWNPGDTAGPGVAGLGLAG